VARGDNGRHPYRGGVHHRAGRAQLHPGTTGWRDDQRRTAVVSEATGRHCKFFHRPEIAVRDVLLLGSGKFTKQIKSQKEGH